MPNVLESCFVSHYRNFQFRKEPVNREQVKPKNLLLQILMKWTKLAPDDLFLYSLSPGSRIEIIRKSQNIIRISI